MAADVELSSFFATKESDNLSTDSIQESTKIDDKNTIPMSPSTTDESNTQFNNDTDFANFQLGESVILDSIQCLQFNSIQISSSIFLISESKTTSDIFLVFVFHTMCGMLNSLSQ